MYYAKGNEVWVRQPDVEDARFLTVHETDTGGTVTVEQQAAAIAKILNSEA